MKKKILITMLAFSMVMSTGVYGSQNTDEKTEEAAVETEEAEEAEDTTEEAEDKTEETEAEDNETTEKKEDVIPYRLVEETELEKYIALGEYIGMPLEKTPVVISDEMLETQIQSELQEKLEVESDADAAVVEGDIANINYVGTKDGEAFAGGTADNFDLTIGSGMFIDGFEDGIIGMKKGETKDLSLTFPEEYPAEDLAGQEVIFTVTLNAIKHVPELSDEWIASNTEYKTIDEYKEAMAKKLQEEMQASQDNILINTAYSTIIESSEVKEYPEEEIKKQKEAFELQIDAMAERMGMDRDTLLKEQGMSEEDAEKQAMQYAQYRVKQLLVVQAIMDAENMTFESSEADAMRLQIAQLMGVANFDQILEEYGEEDAYSTLGAQMVAQFILDHAEYSEEETSEEDSSEIEEGTVIEEEEAESEEAIEE